MNAAPDSDGGRTIRLLLLQPSMLILVPGLVAALRDREWQVAAWLHPQARDLLNPTLVNALSQPEPRDTPAAAGGRAIEVAVILAEDEDGGARDAWPEHLRDRLAEIPRLIILPGAGSAAKPHGTACLLATPDLTHAHGANWHGTLDNFGQSVADYAEALLTSDDLRGRTVLVTAGPTVEDLDPVRFLTNRSSGRMGVALARAAWRHGARVRLIHGPLQIPLPVLPGLETTSVRSAQDMHRAVMAAAADADAVIMCAAVADRRPETCRDQKIKKEDGTLSHLALTPTPDILADLGAVPERPFLVGFAAETADLARHARDKLRRKNCDLLCANDVSAADSGFGVDTNRVVIYHRDGRSEALPLGSKHRVAEQIVRRLAREME